MYVEDIEKAFWHGDVDQVCRFFNPPDHGKPELIENLKRQIGFNIKVIKFIEDCDIQSELKFVKKYSGKKIKSELFNRIYGYIIEETEDYVEQINYIYFGKNKYLKVHHIT